MHACEELPEIIAALESDRSRLDSVDTIPSLKVQTEVLGFPSVDTIPSLVEDDTSSGEESESEDESRQADSTIDSARAQWKPTGKSVCALLHATDIGGRWTEVVAARLKQSKYRSGKNRRRELNRRSQLGILHEESTLIRNRIDTLIDAAEMHRHCLADWSTDSGLFLHRMQYLKTERGEEGKRCLMVQLCDQKKAESKHTFKVCREQSLTFIDRSRKIKNAYRHLNHVTNVDRHVNVSIRSHSDITSRNQALSPYFLKDSWLDEFGDGPVAVWTITGDDIELVVFILAADSARTAPLDSKVSHIGAHLGHAYEIRWDQPLNTLAELLDVIPRLHRSMGVALDLCTQLVDTLKGSPPVVPPYLSASASLEKLVRFMDGVPSTKMVGKQPAPATLQTQCNALRCSSAALPAVSHSGWSPWLAALVSSTLAWWCVTVMQYFTPEIMQVPASNQHQATTADNSDSSTASSTSSDISNGVSIEVQAAPSEEGQELEHGCDCADSDGSNRCLLGAACDGGCEQLVDGEQVCTCACTTCKARSQRVRSTVQIDKCHLTAAILLQSELVFSSDYMYRWFLRCRFRTWALLGLQRTHLMPDRLEVGGILTPGMSYAATTRLWNDTIRADNDASHLLLYQWAACEMLSAAELGVNTDTLHLLSDADEIFSADLSDQAVLQWHRRRLLTTVTIMGDHDTNTLTFNPETQCFNECALLRIQQMPYLAKTADRLLHAVRARGLHYSPTTVILHAAMRNDASFGAADALQAFADQHGLELFRQPHSMAASAYRTLIMDLPWFRGEPLASGVRSVADFCLCCSLPFCEQGGSCRLPGDFPHFGFFCKQCWSSAVTIRGCKAITRQVTAIQRWFRNPRITQTQLYAESGDDTDSDTGVEFYFRPELIGHYSSNYPTFVSVLPGAKEQPLVEHSLCMLCLQTMAVEQCSSHSERVKSFCGQCWTAERMQCRQLLHEQPTPAAVNHTQPAPTPSRKVGAKHQPVASADYDYEAWSDWLSFCEQPGRPIFPSAASESDEAATRAQILAFVLYSTAQLSADSDTALAKVQAVGRQLEQRDHPNHCFGSGSKPQVLSQFKYIGSESVSASIRAVQGIQSRNRSASIDFVPHAWPVSGRMGSKTQASRGEMVADLAVGHLQHAVPYTAGSYDLCSADDAVEVDAHDYMNDALNEVTFENLGDAAITNISNQLHMMADSEAFYSDSAELEVARTVDELAQSCQALMLQRAMMAMWACISMLLLTSSHVSFSVRSALGGMQAGAGWLTAKIFRLWHKPIISSCCPSMTCNSQQYSAQALDFYNSDSQLYPTERQPASLTLARLARWVSAGGYDARGQRAWAMLANRVKYADHVTDLLWLVRLNESVEQGASRAIAHRAVKALRASTASLRRRPKTTLSAVLVAEELYFQSAAFTAQCLSTVQLAKNAAGICSMSGCWCKSLAKVGGLNACSLEHALASIGDSDLASAVSVAHLSKFSEFKPFIRELSLTRYTADGLLMEFRSSSYCRADSCYLCADVIVGKALSTQGVSFCRQCWDGSHARSQLALDHHVKHQAQWPDQDTSSNSSFEDLDDPLASTKLAAWHYRPTGCWHSRCESPPAAAQVDLASSPLKRLRAAIARKRYILEGDDWLTRVAKKYPLPVSNGTGRIRAPMQRWYPELCRSESMDTNLSSSLSSDGIAEEMPISKWVRRRQQALSAASAVIPVSSLPAYLLCIPSSDAHQLNIRRSQQSKIGQYFR